MSPAGVVPGHFPYGLTNWSHAPVGPDRRWCSRRRPSPSSLGVL